MDLESLVVAIYTIVDDWIKDNPRLCARRGPGRPVVFSDSEVLTLAILSQYPRWRSERDFWRFADVYLREYFPNLVSQGQLNRRIRALESELKTLQHDLACILADGSEIYRVLDTTLIPAIVRVRACRKGLFAGQAAFGRCASKTEWVYGFKVALSVSPEGVITSFGLAEANCDERPVGEFLLKLDGHDTYLADKGFSSATWERHWLQTYGAEVVATPQKSAHRAWPIEACKWASGKRQIVEGVIDCQRT